MRPQLASLLALAAIVMFPTACKNEIDKTQFKSAINNSLAGHHECVWPDPVKLPAEVDPAKDERIRDFDALTDAGLLARAPEEKKRFLVGPKPVNLYDLSDKGHTAWTPDPTQPGYGNFCFGHFSVTTVDTAVPNDPSNPTQYTVNYHYEVIGVPEWATTAESRLTFPKFSKDTSIQSAIATVVKDSSGAWVVTNPQPAHSGR